MVAQAGRYYSDPLMVTRGVTPVYSLSPKIFNIVVDEFILHWDTVVMGGAAVPEGFERSVKTLSNLF